MATTKRPPQKDNDFVRQGHDRILQRMLFFFHCNAHVVWPHLWNDDRPVRWHQGGGDPPLAKPLSNPPASPTRDPALDRDVPGYHAASARAYADFHWLSSAPSQTASQGHQRSDMSCSNRGRTAVCRPSSAICLCNHRLVCACALRTRALFHTLSAALPGRCR